ncbi:hypothetical protein SARC_07448 [Sphaeroforma arctica JP610]|uniref:Short-chain dehydrogenase/reductase 3 n=1 Tax=Sphaeroforma arctica JP610 TaxID=667725 RepID=A0A0L0FTQ5_9EUKA|nr:hypothetical protein SARC_07448 [Sphaeroforma arctica JP610]KNC80187.1 hypothetical protein SARC_07448 [Sphaeroforma arctica JP610]|eukprot:XP_014154089.1 hypothetical protein SARC_07448 [Sphaeroforma arctica JP610]
MMTVFGQEPLNLLPALISIIFSTLKYIKDTIFPTYADLKGEICFLTGAGGGLGREIAIKLAKQGVYMCLCDLNLDSAKVVEAEIIGLGYKAKAYKCDVANPQNIAKLAEQIKKEVGEVTILINNAGMVSGKRLFEATDSQINNTFKVNTLSHFWAARTFIPTMVKRNHGYVVTVASIAAYSATPGLCDYGASKAALIGFHDALRMEVQEAANVKLLCVCPYLIRTPLFNKAKPMKLASIVPTLDPVDVAENLVRGIRVGSDFVLMPGAMWGIPLLKAVLPTPVADYINCLLGAETFMDAYRNKARTE